jgi:hypothetical protein
MRALAAASFALLLASAVRAEDTAAPLIEHKPVTSTERGAKYVEIFARITDQSKFFPQVFYRYGSGSFEKPLDMKPVKGKKDEYGAAVPVKGDLVEYYIEAYDEYGNGPGRAGDPEKPYRVDTTGEGGAVAAAPPAPAPAPKKVEPPPPAPPPVRRVPPPAAATATARAPSGGRTWTWVVGGTGLGMLTGGLLAGMAFTKADDAYSARLKDPSSGSGSMQQQYDANKTLGTTATILTIGGAVLLGGAVALWFIEAPSDNAPSRPGGIQGKNDGDHGVVVAAAPVEGGGAVALAGKF